MSATRTQTVEQASSGAEDHLRSVIDAVPSLVWSALPDGSRDFLNQRWLDYTGLASEAGLGWGWKAVFHPECLAKFEDLWSLSVVSGQSLETEVRLQCAGGEYRWFLMRVVPVRDRQGRIVKWYGTDTDIEDRKRAETLLSGEARILEMLAKGTALTQILDNLCRLAEQVSSDSLVSILLWDPSDNRLRHGAAPSLPKSYTDAIDTIPMDTCWGPCAIAAYHKVPAFFSDLTVYSLCDEYRGLASAHGLRACWSTPILTSAGDVLGTFAILSRKPGNPSTFQQYVIDQMTHLATVAIERSGAEQRLLRSEAYLAEAQKLSRTGSFGWNVVTGELKWSAETYCILEYDRSTQPTLQRVFAKVHPDDLDFVQSELERATHDGTNLDFEHRLLLADGTVRHVHVVAHAFKDASGGMEFVGAVMDIDERKRAAEALRASEQLARGQVEALTRTLDALAMESAPDRLVEHVLRTITEQLSAHSCSVWRRENTADLVSFECAFEHDRLVTGNDAAIAAISPALKVEDVWPWPEVFRTGSPWVLEDIREGPEFPWRDHVLSLGVVTILIVPMLIAGRVEGVLGVRFTCKRSFRDEEMDLAQALANQTMLSMQLARLSASSRQAAIVAERNRMARDIHDTLAQGFTGVIVQLEAGEDAVSRGLMQEAMAHFDLAAELARESLHEARRSVLALRPRSLEEKELHTALDELIRKMTAGTNVHTDFTLEGEPIKLPPEWEENLLRIGQEVLTNALRHAQANRFIVHLLFDSEMFRLRLSDNGCGFDPMRNHDGFGLLGIRERVQGMGGKLTIESACGQGTTISINLPFNNIIG